MVVKELNDKITQISPVYSDTTLLDGHFNVTFGLDNTFTLKFAVFLRHQFEKDEKLKSYVRGSEREDVSVSTIIKDLYEIGCPIDEWVENYFTDVRSKVSAFDALLALYITLKQFNDDRDTRNEQ